MHITKIGTHHTGPLSPTLPYSSSKDISDSSIETAHWGRGFNLSMLDSYTGYNITINTDGTWKQHRLLGEQTAAATGSNFNTFHICLKGNFTVKPDGTLVDTPTSAQLKILKVILIALIENKPGSIGIKVAPGATYNFTALNIDPHRVLQPKHTSCHGDGLSDNFGRNIALNYLKEKYESNLFFYRAICTIMDFFKTTKFGRIMGGPDDFSDEGIIYNELI